MSTLVQLLRCYLERVISDIDVDSSQFNDEDTISLVDTLRTYIKKEKSPKELECDLENGNN